MQTFSATEVAMVDVEITAEERVRYHTYTKIPKWKYEKYLEMCEREARDSEFEREFADYIKFEHAELGLDVTDIEIDLQK